MRRKRKLQDYAEYHVSFRVNRGEMIFEEEASKELLLDIVTRAKRKYDFELKDFSIMDNHVHLIVKPDPKSSLSRIMQWILSVFARTWNKLHHTNGHLWGERFFSRIIEGIVDLIRTFMYIDNNPVKAHLVSRAEDWKYSGLWHHRHKLRQIVEPPDEIICRYLPEHLPC